MAANLQLLKRRIKTAKNISQIAKAMEMISASKIKRAQDATTANKPYASRIERITTSLLHSLTQKKYTHPYLEENESETKMLLVISPDKGLCGSLNANLYRKVMEYKDKKVKVVTVGKKAEQFCASRGFDLQASFLMGSTLPSYTTVITIKELIENEFLSGNVSNVEILYSSFESFFSQVPVVKQLLPVIPLANDEEGVATLPDYTFEPEPQQILDSLLPYFLETQIYQAFIEAHTSEQAARMMAMQNAKNAALDIADYLTLTYNKLRQERITNEILDLNNSKIV